MCRTLNQSSRSQNLDIGPYTSDQTRREPMNTHCGRPPAVVRRNLRAERLIIATTHVARSCGVRYQPSVTQMVDCRITRRRSAWSRTASAVLRCQVPECVIHIRRRNAANRLPHALAQCVIHIRGRRHGGSMSIFGIERRALERSRV